MTDPKTCPKCGSASKQTFKKDCIYSNSADPWHNEQPASAPVAGSRASTPPQEGVVPAAGGGDICDICKCTLEGVRIGHGDGTGSRFAHPDCYWREQAEMFERQRDEARRELTGAKAKIAELQKACSEMNSALSRCAYLSGPPNEQEVSWYDVEPYPQAAVDAVQKMRSELETRLAFARVETVEEFLDAMCSAMDDDCPPRTLLERLRALASAPPGCQGSGVGV